jgi:hypothetical protein
MKRNIADTSLKSGASAFFVLGRGSLRRECLSRLPDLELKISNKNVTSTNDHTFINSAEALPNRSVLADFYLWEKGCVSRGITRSIVGVPVEITIITDGKSSKLTVTPAREAM